LGETTEKQKEGREKKKTNSQRIGRKRKGEREIEA
jgi:hypothetical protein